MKAGVFMVDIEKIIKNVDATMSMENMPLTEENKNMLRECLAGSVSFDTALNTLLNKYFHESVTL